MQLKFSFVLLACLELAGSAYAGTLRASAVQVDITPHTPQWLAGYKARQSDGVHDHLYHRIAVLDDGKTTVLGELKSRSARRTLRLPQVCLPPIYRQMEQQRIERELAGTKWQEMNDNKPAGRKR